MTDEGSTAFHRQGTQYNLNLITDNEKVIRPEVLRFAQDEMKTAIFYTGSPPFAGMIISQGIISWIPYQVRAEK
jgi:hypothetical protein